MTVLDGFFQGLLQGLTEFLPISSSGHLSLYQHFTGNSGEGALLFTVMLHLGTLAAVIASYYEDLWGMLKEVGVIFKEIVSGQFSIKKKTQYRWLLYMLIIACVPMLLLIPLNNFVSGFSEDSGIMVEGFCFLFTSLLLFASAGARPGRAGLANMKPLHASIIGFFQFLAAMPGISRSGSTISSGMIIGFDREFMAKFSFLLGIPAILGGAVFKLGDAMEQEVEVNMAAMLVGILTAAVVGYFAIKLVRLILAKNLWKIFAWYTLVLGILVVVIGAVQNIAGGLGDSSSLSQAASSLASSAASVASSAGAAV